MIVYARPDMGMAFVLYGIYKLFAEIFIISSFSLQMFTVKDNICMWVVKGFGLKFCFDLNGRIKNPKNVPKIWDLTLNFVVFHHFFGIITANLPLKWRKIGLGNHQKAVLSPTKPPDKAIIVHIFELVHHSVGRTHRTPIFRGVPIHKFGRKDGQFHIVFVIAFQDFVYSLYRWLFHIANGLLVAQYAMTAFSGFHSFTSHSDKHLTMYVWSQGWSVERPRGRFVGMVDKSTTKREKDLRNDILTKKP